MANSPANRCMYLLASADIDFSTHVFKIILMQAGFVFDRDAHHDYGDVVANELPNGDGYTTGGATLANVVITEDDVNDWTLIEWDDVDWIAGPGDLGPTDGAVIYDDSDPNDSLVGYLDFLADYTQGAGGTATIVNPSVRIRRYPT